jgi:hypothetical protein
MVFNHQIISVDHLVIVLETSIASISLVFQAHNFSDIPA